MKTYAIDTTPKCDAVLALDIVREKLGNLDGERFEAASEGILFYLAGGQSVEEAARLTAEEIA